MSIKLLAGRYELLEKIGDGGMAVVYKARCRLLNRFVAIKILKPEFVKDPNIIESFRRESQAAAGLNHPNIVSIYDVGKEGNVHYIVMELIEGKPLSDMIEEEGPFEYRKVINITKQIAAGLSFAHHNNIIHRDIKPHNILMTQDGTAKIADFGIAKAITESTMTGSEGEEMVMGSVHYFSPEQARGGYVDAKSDIYSLGIVMYEMLTGRVPFDGDTPVQVALMHMNEPMIPPSHFVPGIPSRLESIIMKCTDKVSVNRFSSADELIEELDEMLKVTRIVGEAAINPEHIDFDERDQKRRIEEAEREKQKKKKEREKKKKTRNIIIIAVLAVIVAAICIFVFGGNEEVKVPNVLGMTYENAEAELHKKGLEIEKGNEVFSDEYKAGEIVSQSPKADMKVKKGKVIRVNISKGAGTAIVPSLIGMTVDEAKAKLEESGFTLGSVDEAESSSPAGTVISQDPGAGVEVESSQTVNIVIAKAIEKKMATMPGLLGKSLESAKTAIENANLSVGNVTYEYSADYPEGQVMKQQYSSGKELEQGTSVSITISKGPQPEPVDPVEPEDPDDPGVDPDQPDTPDEPEEGTE